MTNRKKILITGATGLVGKNLAALLCNDFHIFTPTRKECDLLSEKSMTTYIASVQPDSIIHAAAYTNIVAAEEERGQVNGIVWQTNVESTRILQQLAIQFSCRFFYISTGSVFSVPKDKNNAILEMDAPGEAQNLSWYAQTKLAGEKETTDTIIRIAHPIGIDPVLCAKDYVHRMLSVQYLYPLVTDMMTSVTFFPDVANFIQRALESKERGIAHVTSPDGVTPYQLYMEAMRVQGKTNDTISTQTYRELEKTAPFSQRYTRFTMLSVIETQKRWGIVFTPWKRAIAEIYTKYVSGD